MSTDTDNYTDSLLLCSHNIQGDWLHKIDDIVKHYKYHIISLQETHLFKHQQNLINKHIPPNYIALHAALDLTILSNNLTSSQTKKAKHGVTTIVHKSIYPNIINKYISADSRVVSFLFKLNNQFITHINIYAPAQPTDKLNFWNTELPKVVYRLNPPPNSMLILAGDINYNLNLIDTFTHSHPLKRFMSSFDLLDTYTDEGYSRIQTYNNNTTPSFTRLDGHLISHDYIHLTTASTVAKPKDLVIKSDHLPSTLSLYLPKVSLTQISPPNPITKVTHKYRLGKNKTETISQFAKDLSLTFNNTHWKSVTDSPITSLDVLNQTTINFTTTIVKSARRILCWKRTTLSSHHSPRINKRHDPVIHARKETVNKHRNKINRLIKTIHDYQRRNKQPSAPKIQAMEKSFFKIDSPNTPHISFNSLNEFLTALTNTANTLNTEFNKLKKQQSAYFKKQWKKKLDRIKYDNSHKFFKAAKQTITKSNIKPTIVTKKDINNNTITFSTDKEVVQEITDYFTNLLGSKHNNPNNPNEQFWFHNRTKPITHPTSSSLSSPVTLTELTSAISILPNRKSPGHDELPNELIKMLPERAIYILLHIFNTCIQLSDIPDYWKLGIVNPIFKDGNHTDLNNYRGITLLPNTYKLLMCILNSRLQIYIENNSDTDSFSHTQYGFRNKRSTLMPLHILNNTIIDSTTFNKELCLIFVDIIKAFDSVELWSVIEGLEWKGIDTKTTNLIKNINTNCFVKIITPYGLTEQIHTNRGVKQGCPLSPLLWNCVLDCILHYLNTHNIGYTILNEQSIINNLAVADDIILLANSIVSAQSLLDFLDMFLNYHGLKINVKKSGYMFIPSIPKHKHNNNHHINNPNNIIKLYNTPLPFLKDGITYKYLGLHVQPSLNWAKHVKHINSKVTPTLESLARNTLYSDQYVRAINAITVPAITYGMGITNLSKTAINAFDRKHRALLKARKHWFKNTTSHLFHSPTELFGFGLISIECANEYHTAHSFYRNLNLNNPLLTTTTFELWKKLQSIHADPNLLFIDTSPLTKTSHALFFNICKKYGIKLNSNHPLVNPAVRLDEPDFYLPHSSLTKKSFISNNLQYNINATNLYNTDFTTKSASQLDPTQNPTFDKYKLRTFNDHISTGGRLHDNIIANIEHIKRLSASNNNTPTYQVLPNNQAQPLIIYTDGSASIQMEREDTTIINSAEILNSTNNIITIPAKAGFGVYIPSLNISDAGRTIGIQSSNNSELQAIDHALLHTPPNVHVDIYTDSANSISVVEDISANKFNVYRYVTKPYFHSLLSISKSIQHRNSLLTTTNFTKVLAHSGVVGNENADRLAKDSLTLPDINYYLAQTLPLSASTLEDQPIPNVKRFIKLAQHNNSFVDWKSLSQGENINLNFDRKSTFEILKDAPRVPKYTQQKLVTNNGPWRHTLNLIKHQNINSPVCIHCNSGDDETSTHILLHCEATQQHRSGLLDYFYKSIEKILPTGKRLSLTTVPTPNDNDNNYILINPLIHAVGTIPSKLIETLKSMKAQEDLIKSTLSEILTNTLNKNHQLIRDRVKISVAAAGALEDDPYFQTSI